MIFNTKPTAHTENDTIEIANPAKCDVFLFDIANRTIEKTPHNTENKNMITVVTNKTDIQCSNPFSANLLKTSVLKFINKPNERLARAIIKDTIPRIRLLFSLRIFLTPSRAKAPLSSNPEFILALNSP